MQEGTMDSVGGGHRPTRSVQAGPCNFASPFASDPHSRASETWAGHTTILVEHVQAPRGQPLPYQGGPCVCLQACGGLGTGTHSQRKGRGGRGANDPKHPGLDSRFRCSEPENAEGRRASS
eukprot:EG_transcript_31663